MTTRWPRTTLLIYFEKHSRRAKKFNELLFMVYGLSRIFLALLALHQTIELLVYGRHVSDESSSIVDLNRKDGNKEEGGEK
ncbi:hypothetical protein OUZ56_019888 [Daphnia magna]|uniref:Uncharacterized protein n=1 Tax=Daphnia magna TaxID=35525 RepID=A0ABQ9ZCW9_9CRUS|nr:hypothetical protein OUZ56_019888 [Daphnia magna]